MNPKVGDIWRYVPRNRHVLLIEQPDDYDELTWVGYIFERDCYERWWLGDETTWEYIA